MGFQQKRKMEDARQIRGDAERLVTAWNQRQAKRMPMLLFAEYQRHHPAAE